MQVWALPAMSHRTVAPEIGPVHSTASVADERVPLTWIPFVRVEPESHLLTHIEAARAAAPMRQSTRRHHLPTSETCSDPALPLSARKSASETLFIVASCTLDRPESESDRKATSASCGQQGRTHVAPTHNSNSVRVRLSRQELGDTCSIASSYESWNVQPDNVEVDTAVAHTPSQ